MQCPHCKANVTRKERSGNVCSKCYQEFAFEPKQHPLGLNDLRFQRTVAKISENDKLYFTSSQLQFALSRKRLNSNTTIIFLVVLAIVTSIITLAFYSPAIVVVIPLWIILIIAKMIYSKKKVSLPQTFDEFETSVLNRWKSVHKKYPSKLIVEKFANRDSHQDLRGILLCETEDTVNFLLANQINTDLGLAILTQLKSEIFRNRSDLPVFVLHDASIEGWNFAQQIKAQFGHQRQVIDLGLRPQTAFKSKLTKFRQTAVNIRHNNNLTAEENTWLKQGFYTPLFVMKPAQLIKYVTNQVGQKSKLIKVDNSEKQAKAIGFMTWVGE